MHCPEPLCLQTQVWPHYLLQVSQNIIDENNLNDFSLCYNFDVAREEADNTTAILLKGTLSHLASVHDIVYLCVQRPAVFF